MEPKKRIEWDYYWMAIAKLVSLRATCLRHQYGAVLVKDNQIISSGYNGAVKGAVHCIDGGTCTRIEKNISPGTHYELCNAVHAEQNCLINCKSDKIESTMYVNGAPCIMCAKLLVNSGIIRYVYINAVPEIIEGITILERAKIICVRISSFSLS